MKYILFIFFPFLSWSQSVPLIDNKTDSSTTVRFNYSNDLFVLTDQYFTQGFGLYVQNELKTENPMNVLFFGGPDSRHFFAVDLGHNAYTPTTIRADSLLLNDRPFAATIISHLTAKSFFKPTDLTLFWGVDLGIIGPPAQGKQMQTAIHKATNNAIPLGWQFQLNTALVLDGRIGFKKNLFSNNRFINANVGGGLRGGTLKTDLNMDAALKIGFLKTKTKLALFSAPAVRVVVRDGTLQGALFSGKNVAAASSSSISRFVFEHHFGVSSQFNRFELLFYFSYQSKLLRFDSDHRWGGITIGYHF